MKSLEQIYILNYLSDEVWRAVTGLLDVVERFDRAEKADKETVRKFYFEDAVNSLEMWRTLIGNHTKTWEDSLNEIDLTEVNAELLDDCPDNNTLQNRLRIVKNRYFGTWEITKYDEKQEVFNKLLHIVDKLTDILFNVYEWTEKEAHRKAVQWHDYIIQRWLNVEQLQRYMQGVIDNAEKILNPQSDTTNEQEQTIVKLPPELNTPKAHLIWSKAKHNGWINEDYSFNGTKYQMAYAAECMANALKLKPKWKPFEILWDYKYFPQTRRESKERFGKVERDKEIEASFSL